MKAIQLKKYGLPEDLAIGDVPKPVPVDDEVLIKIHSASINDWDWGLVRGKPFITRLFFGLKKPRITVPGVDVSGIIESAGPEVRSVNVGDEVYCDLSDSGFGGFAEFVCASESILTKKPAAISHNDAAALPHASILALQGLVDKGSVQPGQNILINGAGGNKKEATTGPDMSFFDIPADALRFVIDLNLTGSVLPSQVFGKMMAEQGSGSILNTSSMNSFTPLTKIIGYSAAKAAINNFTQWLAVHIAQNYSANVRVNAIAPGFFETAQNKFLLRNEDESLTPRGQQIIDHTPAGRYGEPEDLLSTMIWLLGPQSRFVTGIVVPIDGGFSAFSGV